MSRSLRFNLALWLSVLVLFFGAAAGTLAFVAMQHRMAKIVDGELLQAAFYGGNAGVRPPKERRPGHEIGETLLLGVPVPHGDPSGLEGLPADLSEGFHDVTVNGVEWRVLVFGGGGGERRVAAQKAEPGGRFAWRKILGEVFPYLLLTACLIGLTLVLIGHFFRPVRRLADAIDNRSENDLAPIPSGNIPSEIRAFVEAINNLLARIARFSETQRRFVADAAHELRLPLTAISLQAEALDNVNLPAAAHDRLAVMRKGIDRCQALINQLLALARAQEHLYGEPEPVVVSDVLREVLESLLPGAEAKGVDLGLVEGEGVLVTAPPVAIQGILQNLLGNAIRYTPAGGRIDVLVRRENNGVAISVNDSGPGIPEDEWDRVCDPFYRCKGDDTQGSGLGLAIVRTIAANLGGHLRLGHADPAAPRGLSATVFLPD